MFKTITEIKAANKAIDGHWFDRDTMKFFDTRIESKVIGGKYFITSERFDKSSPSRLYSIREALPNGRVKTAGEFQKFSSLETAKNALRLIKA